MSSADVTKATLQSQLERALQGFMNKPDPLPGPKAPDRESSEAPQGAAPGARPEAPSAPVAPAAPATPEPSAELAALRAEMAELKKAVAKKPAPVPEVPRPTVRGVEEQVAELRAQVADMEGLREVSTQLPSVPEYASIKHIPDLERLVLQEKRRREEAAREAGEGSRQVSVAEVAKDVKAAYLKTLRSLADNQELLREAGLSKSSTQTTQAGSRALTTELAGSGQPKQTMAYKSTSDMLAGQLKKLGSILGS